MITIEVHNQDIELFNENVFNRTKDDVRALLLRQGYSNISEEDYGYFETLLCDEIHATFTFEFNKLKELDFSPLWKDENEVIFPSREQ